MGRPMQFDADAAVVKAMGVFWRQGYAATTPQTLAGELGIGKGSLYNTFESKHKLFVLALLRYSAHRVEFLGERFGDGDSSRSQIREAMEVLTGFGDHQNGCLLVNATAELGSSDDAVTEVAGGLFGRIEEAFREAIERGQRSGELDASRDASATASALLATVIGTSLLLKAGSDPGRLARTIDTTIENL